MAESGPGTGEIRLIFNAYDENGSGYISLIEFFKLARSLNARITEEEIKKGFHRIDQDGDSLISFEEFLAWWDDR